MTARIPHNQHAIQGPGVAENYARHHEKYAALQFRPLLQQLDLQCGMRCQLCHGRFLEIGSGPGFLTAMMADRYPQAELNALEISGDMIATAKKVVGRHQPSNRVRFIEGSVDDRALMVQLGKFDVVYSTFSLHHWDKPVEALKSMCRSLKNNGIMILQDFKRVLWLHALPVRNGFLDSVRAAYTPGEIRKMLQQVGVEQWCITSVFPFFWHTVLVDK